MCSHGYSPRLLCRALANLLYFVYTEGTGSFSPICATHCSTDINYVRGIQHLINNSHTYQECIKCIFDIYTTKLEMLFKNLHHQKLVCLEKAQETKQCNFSQWHVHFKIVHNGIIFWTYHLT